MLMTYQRKLLFLFCLMAILLVLIMKLDIDTVGQYSPNDAKSSLQRVEILQFYGLDEERKNIYIDAYYMEVKNSFKLFDFINPRGQFYSKKPEEPVTDFSAQRLRYSKEMKEAKFKGDVVVKRSPMMLECQQGVFWLDTEIFNCFERVKAFGLNEKTRDEVTINSEEIKAFFQEHYSLHKGSVFGNIKRPFAHELPTDFSSETLSLYFDQGQTNLEGKVHVKHGEFDITSRKGEILIENYNKKLKYFTFDDDVVVEQKTPKIPGGKRVAYAERVEGIQSEGIVVLTGAPRVIQGRDTIRGTKITLRQGASIIEVDDAASNIIYENKQL